MTPDTRYRDHVACTTEVANARCVPSQGGAREQSTDEEARDGRTIDHYDRTDRRRS